MTYISGIRGKKKKKKKAEWRSDAKDQVETSGLEANLLFHPSELLENQNGALC